PARAHLAGHRAREGEDAAFGGAVVGDGLEAPRRHARHVDDRSAVVATHQLERLARAEERAVEVDADHLVPGLVRHALGHVEVGLYALAADDLHDPRVGLLADALALTG